MKNDSVLQGSRAFCADDMENTRNSARSGLRTGVWSPCALPASSATQSVDLQLVATGEADGPDTSVSTGSVRLTKNKHLPKTLGSLPEPLVGYLLILKVTDFKVTKISPCFADSAGYLTPRTFQHAALRLSCKSR